MCSACKFNFYEYTIKAIQFFETFADHNTFFKDCLPQVLLGPFSNTNIDLHSTLNTGV